MRSDSAWNASEVKPAGPGLPAASARVTTDSISTGSNWTETSGAAVVRGAEMLVDGSRLSRNMGVHSHVKTGQIRQYRFAGQTTGKRAPFRLELELSRLD